MNSGDLYLSLAPIVCSELWPVHSNTKIDGFKLVFLTKITILRRRPIAKALAARASPRGGGTGVVHPVYFPITNFIPRPPTATPQSI